MGALKLIVGDSIPWDDVLDLMKRKANLTEASISLCYLTTVDAVQQTASRPSCHASSTTMDCAHKL